MTETFYAAIADLYDLEFESIDADVDLYLGYAGIVGGPVLELGCGTGRLLVPLARAGFDVLGIDASAAMIARARQRLAREGVTNATAEPGDMRSLGHLAPDRFGLIFSAINSFLHLETREDQIAALQSARRLLHDDGILVLDLFHPTPAALHTMDDRLTHDGHWQRPDGGVIERTSFRRVYPAEQRIETRLTYDQVQPNGDLRRQTASYTMRYIHRFEMEGLLDAAGYALEGVFGSYSLESLDDHSTQMIFVAHRR